MPFTKREDKMADHVADSYPEKPEDEAKSIGYATVNAHKKKKKGRKGKPWPKKEAR